MLRCREVCCQRRLRAGRVGNGGAGQPDDGAARHADDLDERHVRARDGAGRGGKDGLVKRDRQRGRHGIKVERLRGALDGRRRGVGLLGRGGERNGRIQGAWRCGGGGGHHGNGSRGCQKAPGTAAAAAAAAVDAARRGGRFRRHAARLPASILNLNFGRGGASAQGRPGAAGNLAAAEAPRYPLQRP